MEGDNVSRFAQPFHFTVKTFARRKDGKVPFTVETSVHLGISDIDTLDDDNSPLGVGFKKMVEFYKKQGYAHVPELDNE